MGKEEKVIKKYIPGSSEKKKVVMMYLLLGVILVSVAKTDLSDFELSHFKQSLGWWTLFLLVLLLSVVLLFIPLIRWLVVLLLLIVIGVGVVFAKQAWEGDYYIDKKDSPLFVFQAMGDWILNIFDLDLAKKGRDVQEDINQEDINNINNNDKNIDEIILDDDKKFLDK